MALTRAKLQRLVTLKETRQQELTQKSEKGVLDIGEIKMYHETEVAAGRRDGDLATRLGGEIERARSLYEQRVPQHVRLRTDFFQAELVRTLADGDARLLDAKS